MIPDFEAEPATGPLRYTHCVCTDMQEVGNVTRSECSERNHTLAP